MHFFNKFYEVKGLKVNELRNSSSTVGFWAVFALLLLALAASWATASADEGSAENSSERWREMGHELFLEGRMEEALQAYDEALRIDPGNATFWLDRSTILDILAQQARLRALSIFDDDLAKSPGDARAWWGRGVAEYGLGRPQEARGSWERALEIYNETLESDPEDGEAWFEKAEILTSLGRGEEAIGAYERAIEKNSTRAGAAAFTEASLLIQRGRYEEALQSMEEATDLDPENGIFWQYKGDVLRELGRLPEAEAAYSRSRELGIDPLGGMIAITNISAAGEDDFVEIANHLDEAANLQGWTLVVDGDETRSVVLPEYILEPGAMVRVHFGSGEDSGTDLFMKSGIALNDDSTSVSLRDGAGREVSFLGFETLLDRGVAMTRGSGQSEHQ